MSVRKWEWKKKWKKIFHSHRTLHSYIVQVEIFFFLSFQFHFFLLLFVLFPSHSLCSLRSFIHCQSCMAGCLKRLKMMCVCVFVFGRNFHIFSISIFVLYSKKKQCPMNNWLRIWKKIFFFFICSRWKKTGSRNFHQISILIYSVSNLYCHFCSIFFCLLHVCFDI